MNTEDKLEMLEEELKALKTSYEQNASEIIIYEASAPTPGGGVTPTQITFDTVDGLPAMASVRGAIVKRVPYSSGAKWIISGTIFATVFRVYSMQEGTLTVQ